MYVNTCIVFNANWFPKNQHFLIIYVMQNKNRPHYQTNKDIDFSFIWAGIWSLYFYSMSLQWKRNLCICLSNFWVMHTTCMYSSVWFKKWSIRLGTSHKIVSYKLKRTAKKRKRPNLTSLLTTCLIMQQIKILKFRFSY